MPLPNFLLIYSDGRPYNFSDYNDQVLLIVNTATQCGLSSQFTGLEELHQDYKEDGFSVLGFPSNQFKQENLDNDTMAEACQKNFGVTFPLNQLVEVNGSNAEPLYKWLKGEKGGLFNSEIKWNFTKFLINREGNVIKRYSPTTAPETIRKDIENALTTH